MLYYFESGALSKNLALKICKDFEEVIYHVEEQAIHQCIIGSKNKANYHLYANDIHLMTNTIMVITPFQKVFFTPFTVISYFKIDHQPTCELMYEFFQKQMSNSKLLVNAGEKDRSLFFKRIHEKIAKLRDIIETSKSFDFE